MALDQKQTQQINNLIKILSAAGGELGNKSRELITLLYAMQQGIAGLNMDIHSVLDDVSSGKFEKSNFKAYLKTLDITQDQMNKILSIHKEVLKVTDDQIEKTRDFSNILDEVYAREIDRNDLTKKTLSAFDDLNREILLQQKLITSSGVAMNTNVDVLTKQISKQKELTKVFGNEFIPEKEIKDHLATISEVVDNITAKKFDIDGLGKVDTKEAIAALNSVSDEQISLIQAEDELRRKKLKAYAAEASKKKYSIETGAVFNDKGHKLTGAALNSTNKQLDGMVSNYEAIADQAIRQGKLTDDMLRGMSDVEKELVKQLTDARALSSAQMDLLGSSQKNLAVLLKYRPALRGAASANEALADQAERLLSIIPAGLQKFMGIQGAADGIRESMSEALKVFNQKLISSGSASEAVSAAIGTWGKGLSASVGIIGGITLLFTGLFALTSMLQTRYKDMAHEMHISVGEAKELYRSNLDLVASDKNRYLVLKDIQDVQAAYVRSTGTIYGLMTKGGKELTQQLSEMSKVFGYSADTAVGVHQTFKQLGADDEFAKSLQRQLGYVSEMANISPEIVTQDLIDASNEVATYFAGMPEEAGKAAIAVRRMGMNLKQAGQFAKSMLNMEGFLTDMYELNAMGGPDLSKAFELGTQGDVKGAMEAAVDSIGSLEDFNAMHYTTRMKIAQAMGTEVGDLQRSLMIRKKLDGMDQTTKDAVMKRIDQYGDIADMDQESIKRRLGEINSTEKLSVAWEKIKAVLIKSILPAVEAFSEMLEASSPLIDLVIGLFRVLGGVVSGVGEVLKFVFNPLKSARELLEEIKTLFGGTSDAVGDTEAKTLTLTSALVGAGKAFGIFLGARFALKSMVGLAGKLVTKLSGVKDLKGMGGFTETVGEQLQPTKKGGMISKMVSGAKKMVGFGKSKAPDATSQLPDIGNESKGMVDKVTSLGSKMKSGLSSIADSVRKGFESFAELMRGGVALIKDVLVGLTEMVGQIIVTLGASVAQIIKSLLTGIGDGLSSFSPKALIGAAAILVLSGALWVTSKALQNFTDVSWGDIAKAGVALGGLAIVALAMGGAVPAMLLGAVAIAALGAALIPAAYALQMFGDVSWESLAQAGVALAGLGLAGAAFGAFAPLLLVGAIAIAALGAALIPAAYALQMFGDVSWESLAQAGVALVGLGIIGAAFGAAAPLLLVGAVAIAALGASLIPFASVMERLAVVDLKSIGEGLSSLASGMASLTIGSIGAEISSLVAESPLEKLEKLAGIAAPLDIAAKAINMLGESILTLSAALADADFSKLSEFEKLKGMADSVGARFNLGASDVRALPPPTESTAQNVRINDIQSTSTEPGGSTSDSVADAVAGMRQGGGTMKLEMLIKQLIEETRAMSARPLVIQFDDGTIKTLNNKIKSQNNGR